MAATNATKPEQLKRRGTTEPRTTSSKASQTTTVPTELVGQADQTCDSDTKIRSTCCSKRSEFMLHLNPGKGSILPQLLQVSRSWHQDTKERKVPLRHLLALNMMQTLEARTKILMDAEPTEDLFQDCVQYHLVVNNKDKTMPFLRWDISIAVFNRQKLLESRLRWSTRTSAAL